MLNFKDFLHEKRGLWDNIHAKRERIKNGSGERMRKPGEKGAPTAADFKAASVKEENNIGYEGTDKLTQHRKKMTPGEKPKTPDMFPDWCECENIEKDK